MQRIDPAWLYNVGAAIRPLSKVSTETDWFEDAASFVNAREQVAVAINANNLYSASLRQSVPRGVDLWHVINNMISRMGNDDWIGFFNAGEVKVLQDALTAFESAYLTELQNSSTYYVSPKGGFDLEYLIHGGEELFPESMAAKVPAAVPDVKEGARSLAFELWTGSGFHFHRANETVLRDYMDHEAPGKRGPKSPMGWIVREMKKLGVGHPPILAALDNLIEFHRNPLAHPQHTIETKDEALSLYAAIRAAMGYMLDKLPDPPPSVLRMPTTQTIVAPAPAAKAP